jgi:hypothetical protein
VGDDRRVVLRLQAVDRDADMDLALTPEQQLVGVGAVIDDERGILLDQPVQRARELDVVAALLGVAIAAAAAVDINSTGSIAFDKCTWKPLSMRGTRPVAPPSRKRISPASTVGRTTSSERNSFSWRNNYRAQCPSAYRSTAI